MMLGCTTTTKVENKHFFNYDFIDYYFTEIDDEEANKLGSKPMGQRSAMDSMKINVVFGLIPVNKVDTTFINKLELFGYKKDSISPEFFGEINEIFREKKVEKLLFNLCSRTFRDILIFKKKNKITGIAKLCFGCNSFYIIGTEYDTNNFGQNGDYQKLEKLLMDCKKNSQNTY